MSGRIALVTGANKGIGLAVARELGLRGCTVLVGSRDATRGAAAVDGLRAEGVDAHLQLLDVRDAASVRRAARDVGGRDGRLDVLVNNAAVKLEFHPAPPSRTPIEVIRETYDTNVFGTMQVIQAMLPLLLESSSPRIVNVSSGLGSLTWATTPGSKYRERPLLGYNTAKAALNSATIQFANELRDTRIKINVADPGYTRTDMTRQDGARTPEDAAGVIVWLATLPDDGPTGAFFDDNGAVPW
jgi:NAD(P)-dependent dehydrogenase (short-subunit alcohol dehydrogenase family)